MNLCRKLTLDLPKMCPDFQRGVKLAHGTHKPDLQWHRVDDNIVKESRYCSLAISNHFPPLKKPDEILPKFWHIVYE